jgi:hypothetical protein
MRRVTEVSWSRPFDDPIPLPGRRDLVTLRDAGKYIAALPVLRPGFETPG